MIAWAVEIAVALVVVALLVVRVRARRRLRAFVVEDEGYRELWLRRGARETLQAKIAVDDPLRSGLAYTDGFHLFPPPPGGAALFLGAGAGIVPRQLAAWRPDVSVDVVELLPEVLEVAALHFGLRPGPRLALHVGDGRAFLEASDRRWDLIVIDAFGAETFPARLSSVECFTLCRARARVVAVNLAGTLRGSRLPEVWAALAEAFPHVRAFGVPHDGHYDPARRGNTLIFGFVDDPPPPAADPRLPALAAIAATPVEEMPAAAPLRDGRRDEDLAIV